MKILFFFAVFFVFTGSLCAQQQYYRIELLKEGQAILQTTPVSSSDVSWSMILKGKDCVVRDAFANFDLWNSRVNLQLHVDLADFSRFCGGYAAGDSVQVRVEVTNPAHVLYGYAGENTYSVLQKEYSEDFLGANGINLRPRAMIRIDDTTVCGRNGDVITAIVTHAPKGYFVDWVDSRLEPSGSDQARIIGFPGDTVLSLYAILRDRDGKGLDTAYYKLKLKPLPEVDVTPEYDIRSEGETYTLLGTFHEDLDYQWVYSRVPLSRSARKTVSFPEVMGKTDVRYELFVTDRITGCRNSDTAWVYLRPKAPVIDIDTNTTRNDIRISWNADTSYTYSLMGIKWDGYGILEDYHLRHTFTGETDRFALSQKELDTLEFFYMTANRYIPALDRTISSASSDTVGYKVDDLHVQPSNSKKTSNNLISWVFNMEKKGIATSGDLFDQIENNISAVRRWRFETQDYAATAKNPAYGIVPNVSKYIQIFDLKAGDVYQLAVTKQTSFLQYGKLPSKFSYDFLLNNGEKAYTFMACPLSMVGVTKRQDLGDLIPSIDEVSVWDFDQQSFNKAFWYDWLPGWDPDASGDRLTVRPWTPVRIVVAHDVYGWIK